jgi:hypothetical protein
MINIIGITGIIGSGKDTFGKMIQESLAKNNKEEWEIKKYAGHLKIITSLLLNIPLHLLEDRKVKENIISNEWGTMTVRKFMQLLGTDALRDKVHQDIWVNSLFNYYNYHSRWIITDVRFDNEARKIIENQGIIIKIVRNQEVVDNKHISEEGISSNLIYKTVKNFGSLYTLKKEADKISKIILRK